MVLSKYESACIVRKFCKNKVDLKFSTNEASCYKPYYNRIIYNRNSIKNREGLIITDKLFNLHEKYSNLSCLLHEIGHAISFGKSKDVNQLAFIYMEQTEKINSSMKEWNLNLLQVGYCLHVEEERQANEFMLTHLDEAFNYIMKLRQKNRQIIKSRKGVLV